MKGLMFFKVIIVSYRLKVMVKNNSYKGVQLIPTLCFCSDISKILGFFGRVNNCFHQATL